MFITRAIRTKVVTYPIEIKVSLSIIFHHKGAIRLNYYSGIPRTRCSDCILLELMIEHSIRGIPVNSERAYILIFQLICPRDRRDYQV